MKMERIKELRQERGLSQTELAKAIDTAQPNITRWENGINDPTSTQLTKLADFFGCSTDFLLGREDDFGVKINSSAGKKTLCADDFLILFEKLTKNEQKTILTLMSVLIDEKF